jgi:cytoskeletal protein CcmA (bactofilin family)
MTKKRIVLLFVIPIFLAVTIGFGFTATAKAVEFDNDGIIEAGEVINDDLFIANDVVEINGTINGDVFASGSVVEVNGTINGSLVAGPQVIHINGVVTGSVYTLSSSITLGPEAEIGRNVYYLGLNLSAEAGSYIGRDLLVGAYQALLSGEVDRDVQAATGALEITGSVGNNVIAQVAGRGISDQPYFVFDQPGVDTVVPSGIRISESAEIGGSLTYTSSEDQSNSIMISPEDGVNYKYDPQFDTNTPEDFIPIAPAALLSAWIVKRIRVFLTLVILGGLIAWKLPGLLDKIGDKVEKESLPSLGWGIVSIMAVYLGAFLVFGLIIAGAIFFGVISLGELAWAVLAIGFSSMGLIMTVFGLLVSYGSKLVVAYLVGKLLLAWLAPKFEGSAFWPMLLGILLYTFLRAIPLGFGFVVGVLVTLIGLGAMWLYYRDLTGSASSKS